MPAFFMEKLRSDPSGDQFDERERTDEKAKAGQPACGGARFIAQRDVLAVEPMIWLTLS